MPEENLIFITAELITDIFNFMSAASSDASNHQPDGHHHGDQEGYVDPANPEDVAEIHVVHDSRIPDWSLCVNFREAQLSSLVRPAQPP